VVAVAVCSALVLAANLRHNRLFALLLALLLAALVEMLLALLALSSTLQFDDWPKLVS
jgi:hypothetical protein